MTLEQPETINRYQPRTPEVPPVAEAIRLMRNVAIGEAPDPRWNVGYAEGVAATMAICDPWCQDAEDINLWRECAQMHDARPADDDRAVFRRKRAWFEYIRTAAERSVDQ
jgi:hypothetical protein